IHRRAGKTTAALNHLQRDALLHKNSRYAYIAPTYKMAKNVAWDIIKQYSKDVPNVEYNEAELTVKYPNGAKLTLYGSDNPDALRGMGLWGVVFDEYSQQPSNIFTEIIRPALADHSGYAVWIGTPKGKNEFYRLYEYGKGDEDWLSVLLTADDTNVISQEELIDARKIMSLDEFNQEWHCSFEAAIKGAYYAKELNDARNQGRICNVPHEVNLPVLTWWDLGIGDSTVIGFFQLVGKEWRMIDYYETSGEGLAHYAKVLQDKGYVYGEHFAPHDIKVRELGSGKSRLEMAKTLGIKFSVVSNLSIDDGINAVRTRFNTLWIDEVKCAQFINAIALYRKEWDDKRGEFKNKPFHDWTSHAADMLRYWAVENYREDKQQVSSYI
ncbi:hypothetical protein LCGC14_2919600, partial [marine sediment metagenome]